MPTLHARNIGNNLVFYQGHMKRLVDAFGPDVIKYDDDFVWSTIPAADTVLGWTVTLVEAGAGESTITKPDGSGGTLVLTTDAADNDGINMQLAGEAFQLTSGQSAVYFGIRCQANDVVQSDLLVGLCITDTDLLGGMTDGVYFRKVDGSAAVEAVTEKNSTESADAAAHTMVVDTWTTYEFYYEAAKVYFFVNGVQVGTVHTTNIVDDELITPSIHFLTGEANSAALTIDWIRAIQIGR